MWDHSCPTFFSPRLHIFSHSFLDNHRTTAFPPRLLECILNLTISTTSPPLELLVDDRPPPNPPRSPQSHHGIAHVREVGMNAAM